MRSEALGLAAACALGALVTLWLTFEPQPEVSFFGLWNTRSFGFAVVLLLVSCLVLLYGSSKNNFLRTIFVLLQMVMALVLLEIAGFTGLIDYPALMSGKPIIKSNQLGSVQASYIDEEGETYQDIAVRLGINHSPIDFQYKTGRHGFRNPHDPDSVELYLVGDSMVVGATVPFEQTIAGRLRQLLNAEVLNVALIGIGVQQQQTLFRQSQLPVSNRLVVQFVYEGNDLVDSRSFFDLQSEGWQQRLVGRWQNSLTNSLIVFAQQLSLPEKTIRAIRGREEYQCDIKGTSYKFLFGADSFVGYENEQQHIFQSIEDFSTDIRDGDGAIALVFIPSKLRVLNNLCKWPNRKFSVQEHLSPLHEQMRLWAIDRNIPLLDLTPMLIEHAENEAVPWFWGDTHMNEVGHFVAAKAIASWSVVQQRK